MGGVKTTYHIDHKGGGSLVSPEFEAVLKEEMEKEGIMPTYPDQEDIDANGEFRQTHPTPIQGRQLVIKGFHDDLHDQIDAVVEVVERRANQVAHKRDASIGFAEKTPIEFTTDRGILMVGEIVVSMKAKPAPPEK
jgi:hypothetical protein